MRRSGTRPPVRRRPSDPYCGSACASGEALRILLVEDNLRFAQSLALALGDAHEVVIAASTREAISTLESEGFDAVLLDLGLPDRPGEELYAELLTRWPALAPRVIFLTGGAYTMAAASLLARLPNVRLEKPFELERLREVLDRIKGG